MKNTAKKVGLIITISVVCALIAATLAMTFIPYSFLMDVNNPDVITVYYNSKSGTFTQTDSKDVYNNIINKLEKSFEQSALSALFNGDLGEKATLKSSSTTLSLTSGSYVKYSYTTPQSFTYNNNQYKYKSLIFKLASSADEFETTTAYLILENESNENYSRYQYTIQANYAGLLDYLSEISDVSLVG